MAEPANVKKDEDGKAKSIKKSLHEQKQANSLKQMTGHGDTYESD